MKRSDLELYLCPELHTRLSLKSAEEADGEVVTGTLIAENGKEYQIENGIPRSDLSTYVAREDAFARSFYDGRAEAYDKNLHLTFETHGEDEQKLRNEFIDLLELSELQRAWKYRWNRQRFRNHSRPPWRRRTALCSGHLARNAGEMSCSAREHSCVRQL
jgi:uncharacterized protein YbaR (Trm112 family)